MSLLLATLVDGAIVLMLALAAVTLLRRRSASLRHAILASAVVCAGAMPALELWLPQVPLLTWPRSDAASSSGARFVSDIGALGVTTADQIVGLDSGIPWSWLVVVPWLGGATVLAAGLLVGLVRLGRLRARAVPLDGRWRHLLDSLSREAGVRRQVRLLQSERHSILVTCGIFRPTIIVPAVASTWSDERMRIVLRHELAHIQRHDAALQLAGECLRVLQWPNPLVWIACRRLRLESEYACDAALLREGIEPTDYATQLLDVARQLSQPQPSWASAHAVAHHSSLERRVAAMLDHSRSRAHVTRLGWSCVAAAVVAISLPLAAAGLADPLTPAALDENDSLIQPATIAPSSPQTTSTSPSPGTPKSTITAVVPRFVPRVIQTAGFAVTVLDPAGGTLPGAQVTLTEASTETPFTQATNASGQVAFANLRPGEYQLRITLPGFKSASGRMNLTAGSSPHPTIKLGIGTLQETITVVCAAPLTSAGWLRSAADVAFGQFIGVVHAQEPPTLVRVGGNLRAPKKIKDVKPRCPSTPQSDTAVRVTATLGTDGLLSDLKVVPSEAGGEPPSEFVEAAFDALRQWVFTPTLLNGEAVNVEVSVDITFKSS